MKQVGRFCWKVHLFALCLARGKVVYSFVLRIHSFWVKYFHRFLEPNTESHSCKDQWVCITDTWTFFKKLNQTKTKPNKKNKTKNMLNSSLWFSLKFSSCRTGTELPESAQNCFFTISVGFFLCFPTLYISPSLYEWCIFIYFYLNLGQFA